MLIFAAICPAWLLLTYFAEPLVRLLFTDAYVAAAPYFQVFLLLMVRQCFQFSTPLRGVEDNASFAHANLIALVINAATHRRADAEVRPVGPDARAGRSGRPGRLSTWRSRVLKRYQPAAVGTVPVEQARAGAGRIAGRAGGACTPTQLYLPARHRSACCAGARRRSRWCMRSAARIILREEYGYVMRAILRRKAA